MFCLDVTLFLFLVITFVGPPRFHICVCACVNVRQCVFHSTFYIAVLFPCFDSLSFETKPKNSIRTFFLYVVEYDNPMMVVLSNPVITKYIVVFCIAHANLTQMKLLWPLFESISEMFFAILHICHN